jgi:4-amino-4-deoxy-L-arabinose transferase-like glycosyltransferase
LSIAALAFYAVRKGLGANRSVTSAALVAFFLRLVIGVALALLLPVFGYQTSPEHQAGYIYTDAFFRDNQAWTLATSGDSLTTAFTGQYSGDQYGGMLALSALVYRLLSPDAHRPFLILIINATISALGVLCLWKAAGRWFSEKTALLAAWIFALYPESILLGSSQMREALLVPLVAVTFYAMTEIQAAKRSGWLLMLIMAAVMFFIQPLVSFIAFAVLLGVWFFDPGTLGTLKKRRTILIIAISLSILLVTMLVVSSIIANLPSLEGTGPLKIYLTWFRNNFTFQSYILERSSGIFTSLVDSIGKQWSWLVVLVYGIAQPVLPAIVGDPDAATIMRIIGLLRAIGWYALVLFLIYGTFGVLRSRLEFRRYQLLWISVVTWAWIMVSALNAGADQWDNPRYRVILLTWQVVLAAWAWEWARLRRDAWLWRWLLVEAVFVGLFTEWYVGRYYPGILHLDIKWMSLLTLVVCGAILVGGVIWDYFHKKKPGTQDSGL